MNGRKNERFVQFTEKVLRMSGRVKSGLQSLIAGDIRDRQYIQMKH